jgi:hypothetical protein
MERERTLWMAVVLAAMEDLSGKKPEVYEEARSWIFDEDQSADFEEVCDMAGVAADSIRARCAARLPKLAQAA